MKILKGKLNGKEIELQQVDINTAIENFLECEVVYFQTSNYSPFEEHQPAIGFKIEEDQKDLNPLYLFGNIRDNFDYRHCTDRAGRRIDFYIEVNHPH